MISTRSGVLLIDTVVCLTLAKWETVSGRFGGYLKFHGHTATDHGYPCAIAGLAGITARRCCGEEFTPVLRFDFLRAKTLTNIRLKRISSPCSLSGTKPRVGAP